MSVQSVSVETIEESTSARSDAVEPGAPPILDTRAVHKVYRTGSIEVPALKGIDLKVGAGELVAVVGPSGWKTTLLNCLSGLDQIDPGEIYIAGEEIHSMSDRRRTSHRGQATSFVFEAFNLIRPAAALRIAD